MNATASLTVEWASAWLTAVLLLSTRLAPVLTFAPPFTQLRLPRSVRAAVVLALAMALEPVARADALTVGRDMVSLAAAMACELVVGGVLAYALQTAFGAFHIAGRLLDTQAGQSMATVLDPGNPAPAPVLGLLLGLVAGASFFASDGHHELMHVVAASLRAVPLGGPVAVPEPGALIAQTTAMALMALSVAGVAVLAMFVTDIALAAMTRSMPQMNILVLGMQVKGIVLLLALAAMAGALAPLALRAITQAFVFVARVLSA